MKDKIKYFIIIGIFLLPLITFAQTGSGVSSYLENPLKPAVGDTLPEFIQYLIEKIVIPIGATVVVFFIIYAGFLFVTAAGNETKLETAKKAILYAVIGAAILLGAWVIADAIQATINSLK